LLDRVQAAGGTTRALGGTVGKSGGKGAQKLRQVGGQNRSGGTVNHATT
jgi:hypothetical protein